MKTITIWSAAMSFFFTLSLTCTVYEAGRDHFEAAAGNPQVVSELAEIVGRMAAPAVASPQHGNVVAVSAPAKDLRPVIDWVSTEGKPNKINGLLALGLGIGIENDADVPLIQKAYRMESGVIYTFGLANVRGRREIVLERYIGKEYSGWRVREDGSVLNSLHVSPNGDVTRNPGPMRESECDAVREFFRSKVPTSKVG